MPNCNSFLFSFTSFEQTYNIYIYYCPVPVPPNLLNFGDPLTAKVTEKKEVGRHSYMGSRNYTVRTVVHWYKDDLKS